MISYLYARLSLWSRILTWAPSPLRKRMQLRQTQHPLRGSHQSRARRNGDSPGAPPLPPGPPPPAASVGFGLGNGGVGLPLEVAISIKGKDHKGAAAMKFLRQAETEYPALAPVLAVQKAYLAKRGLRGVYKGGIGSYSLALMALHSMQQAAARRAGAEGGVGAGDGCGGEGQGRGSARR